MRLRDYLRPELVLTDLTARDMATTIGQLAERFAAVGVVSSSETVRDRLRAREEAHTTAMGHSLAIPHATLPGLESPVILLALAPEAIPFGPPDSEPVRIFFTILSPPDRQGEHIKLLARVCRLTKHEGFVDELLGAASPDEALAVVRRTDEAHV